MKCLVSRQTNIGMLAEEWLVILYDQAGRLLQKAVERRYLLIFSITISKFQFHITLCRTRGDNLASLTPVSVP
jgi:hypothetical protein